MARLYHILERHYFDRYLLQGSATTSHSDLATQLAVMAAGGAPLRIWVMEGVSPGDWPELPTGATPLLLPEPGAQSAGGDAEGWAAAGGVLLASDPGILALWPGLIHSLTVPPTRSPQCKRILGFDRLEIDLPWAARATALPDSAAGVHNHPHDRVMTGLAAAGWQLRGFRECEVATGQRLSLRGAWLEWVATPELVPPALDRKSQRATWGPPERLALVTALLRERRAQVDRYRQADEGRRRVFKKLKSRLKEVRKERRRLAREAKRLKLRTEELDLRARRLLRAKTYFQQLAGLRCATGTVVSPYSRKGPLERLEDLQEVAGVSGWLRNLAWSHWMRLGVLFQHQPRPLQLDALPKRKPGDKPLSFTIVTPSYQQGHFLQRTMDSVLNQQHPSLEYLVLDGGSTDGTAELLEQYGPRLAYWRSAPDAGQAAAIAEGLKRGTGEIMGWLNSDDMYLPGALLLIDDFFQHNPDVDAVYGHRIIVDSEDLEVGRWVLPPHDGRVLSWVDYVPQESLFWRRSLYEKVGGLDPSLRFAMDWDLLLRFQRAGARIKRLPYFYTTFRAHDQQKSSAMINTVGAEEVERLRKRELGAAFDLPSLYRLTTRVQLRALACHWLFSLGIRI